MGEICADSSMKENQLLLGTASAECCADFGVLLKKGYLEDKEHSKECKDICRLFSAVRFGA